MELIWAKKSSPITCEKHKYMMLSSSFATELRKSLRRLSAFPYSLHTQKQCSGAVGVCVCMCVCVRVCVLQPDSHWSGVGVGQREVQHV